MSVSYSYDTLSRVTAVTYPTGVNSYSYDTLGRLASVIDPTGTTSYAFDALSRITGITTPQGTVNYSYNDANQRTSMSLPGSRSVSYNYDATGRLASLTDWVSGAINYSFDADGQLTGLSRSNGVTSAYGYDAAGRLTAISHDGSGGNLLFTNYTLDANGNRVAMASNGGTENYTLDALNRLTNATYPNGDTAAYSYDANGNRLSQTFNGVTTNYSYDDAGQLLADGTTTYGYDANGNLTSAGADSYTWDWANRMTGATVGGTSATYAYDAFDVRVNGTVSGTSSSYLWDRLAPYPTLVDDGFYGYLHGAGPQSQIDGSGNHHYLLSDALASIRGVTDGSGALVGSTTYDAFGAVRSQTGAGSAFGYTGELYTAATGLLHLRARDLNPTLGRFLSADTVQPNAPGTQGFNLYAYVANNPTLWVDPSGHGLDGYGGTAIFSPRDIVLGAITAMAIDAMLAYAKNPGAWRFPENFRTSGLVLATFALVLACYVSGACGGAAQQYGDAIDEHGSSSPNGAWAGPIGALAVAPYSYPVQPGVVRPIGVPVNVPGTPPVAPQPPPAPGWVGVVILVAALATLGYEIWQTSRPDPTPNPDPLPGPVPGPVSTPPPKPAEQEKFNWFISGGDLPETTDHIHYAIHTLRKSYFLNALPVGGGYPRGWLDSAPECQGRRSDQFCDEYPFASTFQGGQKNAPSLRLVSAAEQRRQGTAIRWFYKRCKVGRSPVPTKDSLFIMVTQNTGKTGYVCKDGASYDHDFNLP